MNNRISAEVFPPGEFLGDELAARGWTQTEFAEIIGRPQKLVNDIVLGKRGITPETATAFAAALGTSAQLWMNLETAYQLSKVSTETGRITREAALRERFPVREMIKRGWIPANKSFDILEESVFSYFNIKSANDPISLPHAARRNYEENQLSVIQWAWIFRVNQLATALKVQKYSADKLKDAIPLIENLMSEPEEIRHVPKVLSSCGVRFVIVEPIPGSKIDGVCFWINENSPTIALSLKGDHIDRFWFNLWHEIEHVLRGDGKDAIVVDDFDDEESQVKESEKAANAAAADHCVPTAQMKDFIARHNPVFSEKSVIGFARIMKRHPGIVVGQIQKKTGRWELFRKLQPRVREIAVQSALTDGYGRTGTMNL